VDDELELAHKHCFGNRSEMLASQVCGCFYCLTIFPPSDVYWIEEDEPPLFRDNVLVGSHKPEPTAAYTNCDVDSVIGSSSGYPITIDFLTRLRQRWFERS